MGRPASTLTGIYGFAISTPKTRSAYEKLDCRQLARLLTEMERSVAWWQRQVDRVQPATCPKCGRQTHVDYLVDISGESRFKRVYRAIMERCSCCGWCHAWMTQEQGGPIEVNTCPRSIRPVGVTLPELTDDEVDEVAKRAKVVRLPGAPINQTRRSEYDRRRYLKNQEKIKKQVKAYKERTKTLTQNRGN